MGSICSTCSVSLTLTFTCCSSLPPLLCSSPPSWHLLSFLSAPSSSPSLPLLLSSSSPLTHPVFSLTFIFSYFSLTSSLHLLILVSSPLFTSSSSMCAHFLFTSSLSPLHLLLLGRHLLLLLSTSGVSFSVKHLFYHFPHRLFFVSSLPSSYFLHLLSSFLLSLTPPLSHFVSVYFLSSSPVKISSVPPVFWSILPSVSSSPSLPQAAGGAAVCLQQQQQQQRIGVLAEGAGGERGGAAERC